MASVHIKTKKQPVLLVSVGAPGSGKSYLATRLCKEYEMVHLRSDEIREYIFPKPTYTPAAQRYVRPYLIGAGK